MVVFMNDPNLLSFFIVLQSCGRKICLNMEIQKIQMVVHIFSGFASFMELITGSVPWN